MSDTFDVDNYFTLMQDLTGIAVQPQWAAMVKFHIANAEKMAALCESAPIDPDSLELSNVFRPGEA